MHALKGTGPASSARTGVWVGIAAIAMSFAAYTSALMVRQAGAPDWRHFRLPPILYLNTALLLASSGTLATARRRLLRAPPDAVSRGADWLVVTLALGLLFLAGQIAAWRDLAAQGLYLATNPSSAFFYVFTALHGLHLLGGIVALGWLVRRVQRAGPRPLAALHAALDATALYWHFMDVLWLYLLLILALRL
jgi:cytochrome c oxidase subunit 3